MIDVLSKFYGSPLCRAGVYCHLCQGSDKASANFRSQVVGTDNIPCPYGGLSRVRPTLRPQIMAQRLQEGATRRTKEERDDQVRRREVARFSMLASDAVSRRERVMTDDTIKATRAHRASKAGTTVRVLLDVPATTGELECLLISSAALDTYVEHLDILFAVPAEMITRAGFGNQPHIYPAGGDEDTSVYIDVETLLARAVDTQHHFVELVGKEIAGALGREVRPRHRLPPVRTDKTLFDAGALLLDPDLKALEPELRRACDLGIVYDTDIKNVSVYVGRDPFLAALTTATGGISFQLVTGFTPTAARGIYVILEKDGFEKDLLPSVQLAVLDFHLAEGAEEGKRDRQGEAKGRESYPTREAAVAATRERHKSDKKAFTLIIDMRGKGGEQIKREAGHILKTSEVELAQMQLVVDDTGQAEELLAGIPAVVIASDVDVTGTVHAIVSEAETPWFAYVGRDVSIRTHRWFEVVLQHYKRMKTVFALGGDLVKVPLTLEMFSAVQTAAWFNGAQFADVDSTTGTWSVWTTNLDFIFSNTPCFLDVAAWARSQHDSDRWLALALPARCIQAGGTLLSLPLNRLGLSASSPPAHGEDAAAVTSDELAALGFMFFDLSIAAAHMDVLYGLFPKLADVQAQSATLINRIKAARQKLDDPGGCQSCKRASILSSLSKDTAALSSLVFGTITEAPAAARKALFDWVKSDINEGIKVLYAQTGGVIYSETQDE